MLLHYRQYGEGRESASPLLFLHGLFGSSVNWSRIIRHFESTHYCIAVDLRNHGRSFHIEGMTYEEQIKDVFTLIESLNCKHVTLVGHSLGGKVAMAFALQYPDLIEKLVIVDIAPVFYQHDFASIIYALRSIGLDQLVNRQQADKELSHYLSDHSLRAFLLQNLQHKDGKWSWRINLDALEHGMQDIKKFPVTGMPFRGETCFIHGNDSSYITDSMKPEILSFFPLAQFQSIKNAGHWVFADQPEAFIKSLEEFLYA